MKRRISKQNCDHKRQKNDKKMLSNIKAGETGSDDGCDGRRAFTKPDEGSSLKEATLPLDYLVQLHTPVCIRVSLGKCVWVKLLIMKLCTLTLLSNATNLIHACPHTM